jgi:hypothetical protein
MKYLIFVLLFNIAGCASLRNKCDCDTDTLDHPCPIECTYGPTHAWEYEETHEHK